jgi:hypothetical protein
MRTVSFFLFTCSSVGDILIRERPFQAAVTYTSILTDVGLMLNFTVLTLHLKTKKKPHPERGKVIGREQKELFIN